MPKITKQDFIAQAEAFMDRQLEREEIDSIRPCECHLTHCNGWVADFKLPSLFEVHAFAGGFDIVQPRLEV